jgi:hypothetical protein
MHVTYSQAALPTNKTAPRTTNFPSSRFFSPEPAEYTTHEQSDPYRILVRRVASGYPLESLIGISPIEEQRLLRPASEGLNTHATCVKRHRQSWYLSNSSSLIALLLLLRSLVHQPFDFLIGARCPSSTILYLELDQHVPHFPLQGSREQGGQAEQEVIP